jgi:hypothetical protein
VEVLVPAIHLSYELAFTQFMRHVQQDLGATAITDEQALRELFDREIESIVVAGLEANAKSGLSATVLYGDEIYNCTSLEDERLVAEED